MSAEFVLNDIHIESSLACSARCVFCPHTDVKRRGSMPFDLFKKIADDAISLGCPRITPFRLGEPLLFPGLFEWLDYLRGKGVIVSLFTNASNLTEEIGKRLLEYSDFVIMTISFHGDTAEKYESNMVGLSFDAVYSNIVNFMKVNKSLPVNLFSLADNPPDIDVERFQKLWQGLPFGGTGTAAYMEWAGARNLWHSKLDSLNAEPEKWHRVPCDYVLRHMDVMVDGHVCLCCVDYQGEVVFGDLKYQSIMDVFNTRLYQHYYQKHLDGTWADLPLCSQCSMSITTTDQAEWRA
jgi:MoaA/NifB/PqqE/SkfB family radical SAM enzyme